MVINGQSSGFVKLVCGVPQGSVLGPKLFTIYSAPIAEIGRKHCLDLHMFADDTQLYVAFRLNMLDEQTDILGKIETCIVEIKEWMTLNKLKLNEDKTEFLVITSPHNRQKVSVDSVDVCGSCVNCVESARNLGAYFDDEMKMETHVTSMCQAAFHRLRMIKCIRRSLTRESTKTVIHAFVTSRLDNGNALLAGLPNSLLNKLQRVHNAAARTILCMKKSDHITPALKALHWLPIKQRIEYKLLVLTWKALHNQAPGYISDLVIPLAHCRTLRSNNQMLLEVPRTKLKSYGDRAFSVAAPKAWNKLPLDVKTITNLETFKQKLKAHMFRCAFES